MLLPTLTLAAPVRTPVGLMLARRLDPGTQPGASGKPHSHLDGSLGPKQPSGTLGGGSRWDHSPTWRKSSTVLVSCPLPPK